MSRAKKAKARPKRVSRKPQAAARHGELTAFLDPLNRSLQKIAALLVVVAFAADHEAEVDVADAVSGVAVLVGHVLAALDQVESNQEVRAMDMDTSQPRGISR